jgi:type II secretory pathway component PulC
LSRGLRCAAGLLAMVGPLARAQTIADYSRAQRAVLESAMTQAAARSAGLVAVAPSTAASLPATAPSAPAPVHAALPPPAPSVEVSGVFASSAGTVAEVVVNSTPYLLEAGERVPGTAWEVRAIAVDRVVLGRQGGAAAADAGAGLRVFALPALR